MSLKKGRIVYSRKGAVYYLGDREVTKEEFDAAFPSKEIGIGADALPAHQSACWPQVMESLAVHPSQVDVANERARKAGIDAVYEKGTGMCQVGSRRDRAKLIRLDGFHDKSGGYSDG